MPTIPRQPLTARWARWCYRNRRRTVLAWVVVVVGVLLLAGIGGSRFANNFELPDSESQRAEDLLRTRFPDEAGDIAFVVFRSAAPADEPAVRTRMSRLFTEIAAVPHVRAVASPYVPGPAAIAADRHTAFATVRFDRPSMELPRSVGQRVTALVETARSSGVEVEVGGHAIKESQEARDLGENVGLAAALIILVITFGSAVAAGLPLLVAGMALGAGLGLVTLLTHVVDVADVTEQLALMIGLGVGIDYALLVVTRYRQELTGGADPVEAVAVAGGTAGRAVVFAGATVVISLLGMFLMGLPFVRGIALGAVVVVLLTMAASLTLLPAALGFAGHAIDRWRLPRLHRAESTSRASLWFRWSRVVQRRPAWAAAAALAVLVVVAAPALSMRLGVADEGRDPTTLTTRRAYDLLARGFGPGFNGPLIVAVEVSPGAAGDRALLRLSAAIGATPGVAVALPAERNRAGDTATLTVIPTTAPQDGATERLVDRLREDSIPRALAGTGASASVGGITAVFIDLSERLTRRLPLVIGAVVGFSFLVLMAVFRSVLVPVKAAVLNLLSVGAAYGVLVAVFQWGWLKGLVGVDRTGPIESYLPPMLFAVLFGLSMDYEVFLLSRVREEYGRTGDNALAVADGLASTARVITAAAAIMVTVFVSFVLGDDRVVKLAGVGLASAIFLDATLVRLVLVPATMELLGDANWWFPRWLDRVVPHVAIDAAPPARLPATATAPTDQ